MAVTITIKNDDQFDPNFNNGSTWRRMSDGNHQLRIRRTTGATVEFSIYEKNGKIPAIQISCSDDNTTKVCTTAALIDGETYTIVAVAFDGSDVTSAAPVKTKAIPFNFVSGKGKTRRKKPAAKPSKKSGKKKK